jgi:DHA1 family solute carrier family 18 vesicular amine transporter 1/2
VNSIGFEWMLFGIAILNFLYAPLMYLLRNPPTKEEKKVRLSRHSHVLPLTADSARLSK